MALRNVTFRLPTELLAEAKRVAAERRVSVNALVRDALVKETAGGLDYDAAMNRQLDLMNAGYRLRKEGESYPARDTLHER